MNTVITIAIAFIKIVFFNLSSHVFSLVYHTIYRSIEVGDSVDSLKCISILNDIEDINEIQDFRIRDFKYTVDDEISAPSSGSNALSAENTSHEISAEKVESKGDDDCQVRPQGISDCSLPTDHCHRYMRIKFTSSADFYGRVTIYNFEVHGLERANPDII